MKDPDKDPLFTVKGIILFAVVGVIYASILFSLDPEWVAWAAPLAFGGSLCASVPPPASVHLALSGGELPWAYLYGCLALFAITLLDLVQSRRHLNWLSWLKAESGYGSVAKLRAFLKSSFLKYWSTSTFSR
jgi:hypothetical protein